MMSEVVKKPTSSSLAELTWNDPFMSSAVGTSHKDRMGAEEGLGVKHQLFSS